MKTKFPLVVLFVGAIFLLEIIFVSVAEARGGGGGGGRGGGGGGRGGGGGSCSRSSPASGVNPNGQVLETTAAWNHGVFYRDKTIATANTFYDPGLTAAQADSQPPQLFAMNDYSTPTPWPTYCTSRVRAITCIIRRRRPRWRHSRPG